MTYTDLSKSWATVLAAMLAALLLSTAAFSSGARAQDPGCTGQVVLDAGHGGTDPGAVNARYNLTEKEQTLKVAYRTKALLEDDYSVCMTRTSNAETLSNND